MQSFDAQSIRRSRAYRVLGVTTHSNLKEMTLKEDYSRTGFECKTININTNLTISASYITGNVVVKDGCTLTLDGCFLIGASIKGNYIAKGTFTDTPIGDIPMLEETPYDKFYEANKGILGIAIDGHGFENLIYDRRLIMVDKEIRFKNCAFFQSKFIQDINMRPDGIKFDYCVYIDNDFNSSFL